MQFQPGFSAESFSGSTLIVPAISIANIPQLAADVLLHSLKLEKAAVLNDTYLYPFVSPVDHAGDVAPHGVSFALEAYLSSDRRITLLHQRAPLLPGFAQKHLDEVIVPFVQASSFERVLFLNLADAGLAPGAGAGSVHVLSGEDVLLKPLDTLAISENALAQQSPDSSLLYGRLFIEKIHRLTTVQVAVIYAYEGDNFFDAQTLASVAAKVLQISEPVWQTPVSWDGVYGDKGVPLALEDGLYG